MIYSFHETLPRLWTWLGFFLLSFLVDFFRDGNPGWDGDGMGWIRRHWPGGVDDLRLGSQWAFYFPGLCGQPGSKESLGWGSFSIGG